MPVTTALTKQSFACRWIALRRPFQQVLPNRWRRWLTDSDSLTQRLIQQSNGNFQIEVVQQRWQQPTLSESCALGIRQRQLALIREVRLIGNNLERSQTFPVFYDKEEHMDLLVFVLFSYWDHGTSAI